MIELTLAGIHATSERVTSAGTGTEGTIEVECDQNTVTWWALIASVAAVAIAAASFWWTRRTHILAPKRDVLRRLLGNRHILTDSMAGHRGAGEPYIALNEIAVAYYRDKEVFRALQRYFAEKSVMNLKTLIREMAKAADSSLDDFDDDFLETPFTPGGGKTCSESEGGDQ